MSRPHGIKTDSDYRTGGPLRCELTTESPMATPDEYERYKARNLEFIEAMLQGVVARPVLFLGSGISRRYVGGPSWMELLAALADRAGLSKDRLTFLAQKAGNDPIILGTLLSEDIFEWAWTTGKNNFPSEYFTDRYEKTIFIKKLASDYLAETAAAHTASKAERAEMDILSKVSPHAIITTNFDPLIEGLFPDYELVVGEKIIPMSMNIMGEIYKIHGTIGDPNSLVLTEEDYKRFSTKRRYISAKMMTYFAEYPVFIIGYGLGDKNVNGIISDLGEALKDKGGVLDNVCYVEWVEDISSLTSLKEEHVIAVDNGALPPLRIKTIVTSDLSWVLKALCDFSSPYPVNTKVLRQLASRVVDLVRVDVPRSEVELNYSHIEKLTDNPTELAMVLGIGNVSSPNLQHPYTLTQVGQMLGYRGWQSVHKLMPLINSAAGKDIKTSDNEFHIAVMAGRKTKIHKYSDRFVELAREAKAQLKADAANSELFQTLSQDESEG